MKSYILFPVLLFFYILSLKAQSDITSSEKTNIDSTKKEKSAMLGGGLIISNLGDLPGVGGDLKAGIGFPFKNLQLNGIIEFGFIHEEDIMFYGSRTRSTKLILPQLMIIHTRILIQPFITLGIGYGNFKINWNEAIAKSNDLIWGIGGGN